MAKMGRPSKYKKSFCDDVIAYGKQGLSKTQMFARLGISWQCFSDWQNPESPRHKPEFCEAIKEAVRLAQAWWEDQAMAHLSDVRAKGGEGRHSNPTMFIFQMCNRFSKHYKRSDKEIESETKPTSIQINIHDSQVED